MKTEAKFVSCVKNPDCMSKKIYRRVCRDWYYREKKSVHSVFKGNDKFQLKKVFLVPVAGSGGKHVY